MSQQLLTSQTSSYMKQRPEIRPGYTVRVHQKVEEGGKQRTQVFEGLVIGVHKGHIATDFSFTVRRIASGIGVEKVFALHSPLIDKIEVKKVAKVRRAKLNFLRGRGGKNAKLSERFTNADEFKIAAAPEPVKEVAEQTVVEAKTEEVPAAEAAPDAVQN